MTLITGSHTVPVAAVQMNPRLGDVTANRQRIEELFLQAAHEGARLVAFPECALTGYCFQDRAEARPHAETIPGPSSESLAALCRDKNAYLLVGLLESSGDDLFNACMLLGPTGLVSTYRKIHLPFLGVDRFTTPGDRPFAVQTLADLDLRVGMHICYDGSFPESARVMALGGADLLVLPTNWPPGAECAAEHMVATRAMENVCYYMAINRVGEERGFRFIGRSSIAGPGGEVLTIASADDEAILHARIDPQRARNKHVVRVPGLHEIDRIHDRRPDFYRSLLASGPSMGGERTP